MYPKAQYETNINYQGPPWRNFFPHCTFRPCVVGDAGKLLVTGTGWAGDFLLLPLLLQLSGTETGPRKKQELQGSE